MRSRRYLPVFFAALLVVLACVFAWDQIRVDRTVVKKPAIASNAPSLSTTSHPQRKSHAKKRGPLVFHPPRATEDTGTAAADAVFAVSVYFETKSGEEMAGGYVFGCGHFEPEWTTNGTRLQIEDLPCTMTAFIDDGLLYRRSAPADVEPESEDLTFTFPDERTGGIGVQIATTADGVVIRDVIPGGPAEELGLEPGDVVVAVQGKDAKELSIDEFVETMTGPEGSDVEFVLKVQGDSGAEFETIRVERRYLGS